MCYDADFYPFGGERAYTTNCTQNYKFTGKERDSESGLDDFDARYYSSQYGRFISPDWSAKAEPVPYAKLGNPQSLNLYAYVGNNPVTLTDHDGHCAQADTVACQAILSAVREGATPEAAVQTGQQAQNTGQTSGQNQPNQPASGQQQQPSSWDKTKPLPDDPSKLGPEWRKNPDHKAPYGEEYINDKTGEKIEWNKGRPGPWGPKTDRGKDGWHYTPPGGERGRQLDPGQTVSRVGVGAAIAAGVGYAVHVIIETAPEWAPVLAIP